MSAWRTWARLSRAERGLLLGAGVRVAVVRVALWVMPSSWIVRYVTRLAAEGAISRPPSGQDKTILWAVGAVARRVPDASCLTQAIAALLLLRRHGYAAKFCVGVARADTGALDAHAWLEREGRILIGRRTRTYVRMPDLAGLP